MTAARVLVAPDRFAAPGPGPGTRTVLRAAAVAGALATGWQRHDPSAVVDLAPMSDGGPGFVDGLRAGVPGSVHRLVAGPGPDGAPVDADVLRADDGTVYVEALVSADLLGGLLAAVRDGLEPVRVVVAVAGAPSSGPPGPGGAAGGAGSVRALVGPGGWPAAVPLLVATDVEPPPVVAGAGTGVVTALLELGGRRVGAVQTVIDAVGLEARARTAHLLVTGEAVFDATSLQGRVPRGVAWVAQRSARPCVVLAGRVLVGRREFSAAGVDAAYSLEEPAGSGDEIAARLADLAERVARTWTPR